MRTTKRLALYLGLAGLTWAIVAGSAVAQYGNNGNNGNNSKNNADCGNLPTHARLESALKQARNQANGGFNLDMWGTVVNRDGVVCAVAFTGSQRGDQWPGSRVISAQKANTANAFSLPHLALSTANLYTAVQPGGSLFGLQFSNPVNTDVAYAGDAVRYGQVDDPMVGGKIGGVNIPSAAAPQQQSQRDCQLCLSDCRQLKTQRSGLRQVHNPL